MIASLPRLGLLLALSLPAFVQSAKSAMPLQVERAWIRSAPPNAPVMAGYGTLRNQGRSTAKATGLRSAAFGRVELHEMREVGGVMRMRPLSLVLGPGEQLTLQPGGAHLMLMHPTAPLANGARVAVEIRFEDGAVQSVEFEVRAKAPAG